MCLQQCVRWAIVAMIGVDDGPSSARSSSGEARRARPLPTVTAGSRNAVPARDLNNMIAVSGPSSHFAASQPPSGAQAAAGRAAGLAPELGAGDRDPAGHSARAAPGGWLDDSRRFAAAGHSFPDRFDRA